MKRFAFLAILAILALAVASAAAVDSQDKGAETIGLDGGKSGPVPFPHHLHQNVLVDCMICHSVFPQKPGSINALKASGELKEKQVMNRQCTACHRKMKKEGKKTGPITCTSCHEKNG